MRTRYFWLIVVGAGLLLAAVRLGRHREPAWDYSYRVLEEPQDMRAVYDLGEDGWEVAGVFKDWHGHQCLLLKRPL